MRSITHLGHMIIVNRFEDVLVLGLFLRERPEDEELAEIVSQILEFTHTPPDDR